MERPRCTISTGRIPSTKSTSTSSSADPFHAIKLLNDRVDIARRRLANTVHWRTADKIKGFRCLFLSNCEELRPRDAARLAKIFEIPECRDLACVHLFKERLRSIYMQAQVYEEAKALFDEWIQDAIHTGLRLLKSVAKTFLKNYDGILAYWKCGKQNNASMEGFNRKVRGLMERAYGLRDYQFFKLRIFDLGERRPVVG